VGTLPVALLCGLLAACGASAGDECDDPPCLRDGDGGIIQQEVDGGGAGHDGGVLGDFAEPAIIEPISDPNTSEADPSVTGDGLELYFSSSRTGNTDIYVTRRDSLSDPWDPPDLVEELSSADADLDPEVSADGLTIWINSTRAVAGAKGGYDLFVATRDSRDDVWPTPQLEPILNSADSDMGAVMNQAQTILIFHRDTGMLDLYQSTRSSREADWGTPIALDGLNTGDQEADAWLSPNGLTLYFNSNRASGTGSSDIYVTTRLSTGSLFTLPEEVVELNTSLHEANVALSADQRRAFISSARSGDQEIYEASR
jgi:hypothetical protein